MRGCGEIGGGGMCWFNADDISPRVSAISRVP